MLKTWAGPQLFGIEGATPIYFTSQGLEQFLPKPLALSLRLFLVVKYPELVCRGIEHSRVFDQNVFLSIDMYLSTKGGIFTKLYQAIQGLSSRELMSLLCLKPC